MIPVTDDLSIDEGELTFTYIRASGPGGQNVNKVSTAAQLRFDAARSPSLPEPVKARLLRLAGARATTNGEIVITAARFRSQERNRADAVDRLVALIVRATFTPKPRRQTRPTTASKTRRLQTKARRSGLKALRSRPDDD